MQHCYHDLALKFTHTFVIPYIVASYPQYLCAIPRDYDLEKKALVPGLPDRFHFPFSIFSVPVSHFPFLISRLLLSVPMPAMALFSEIIKEQCR